MFHWICPECGREIPPAVKECPACDPHAVASQGPPALPEPMAVRDMPPVLNVPANVPAAAGATPTVERETLASVASYGGVAVLEAPSEGAEVLGVESLGADEPDPKSVPPPLPQLDAPERALTEQAGLGQILAEPALPEPALPEPALPEPALQLLALVLTPLPLALPAPASPVPVQILLPPVVAAGRAPTIIPSGPPPLPDVTALADAVRPFEYVAVPADTGPSETLRAKGPSIEAAPAASAPSLNIEVPPSAPPPSALPLATSLMALRVPAGGGAVGGGTSGTAIRTSESHRLPAPGTPVKLMPASRVAILASEAIPPLVSRQKPLPGASAMRPVGLPLNIAQHGLPTAADAPLGSAGAGSTSEQASSEQAPSEPAAGATVRPRSLQPLAAPAMAGLVDYSVAALRAMRPARPSARMFVRSADPRITLPGPALPRELNSLGDAGLSTVLENPFGAKRRRSGLSVMLMALVAVVLCGGMLLLIVPPLLPNGKASPGTSQTQPEATGSSPAPASAPASGNVHPLSSAYPLAKTIEVSGFRFVVDLNSKSEIHYLVVNHSAVAFGGVMVFVTLRTADAKPGQPPVARFSFRAPDLEAYGSREMTSPIEKMSRAVTLPDWQDLRVEVEIAE